MPIITIQQLKDQFVPGNKITSEYFQNLVDTLADDRSAIHIGMSEPKDGSASPLWFNDSASTLHVFNGTGWTLVAEKENQKYNLPEEDGLPGQVLVTDGNGNVTWKTL
jgi:hypothetical protein